MEIEERLQARIHQGRQQVSHTECCCQGSPCQYDGYTEKEFGHQSSWLSSIEIFKERVGVIRSRHQHRVSPYWTNLRAQAKNPNNFQREIIHPPKGSQVGRP
jgi:hypothetical protein